MTEQRGVESMANDDGGLTPALLIVEDDEGVNRLVQKRLAQNGFQSVGVFTGSEALAAIEKMGDVLMLLDYKLPDMTGEELLRRLSEKGKRIPFIVMTGFDETKIAVEMMKLGAFDYIVKAPSFCDAVPQIVKQAIDKIVSSRLLDRTMHALIKSEMSLRESTQRWQTTFNAIEDPILLLDAGHGIVACNRSFTKLFHCDEATIVGRPCCEVVHGTVEPIGECPFVTTRKSIQREHAVVTIGDRTVDLITDPVLDENGAFSGAVHIISDITDHKRAEDEIRSTKGFLDSVINAIADPIFVKNDKREFVLVNDALCAIVGRPREALLGKDGDDMFPKEQVAVFQKIDADVLNTGKESLNEESLSNLTSGEVRTIVTRKTRYIDPAGNKFLVGVIRDITERKNAEEQRLKLEARLHHSQKMEAIGQLAGGIAHDFNNLLGGVIGYTDLVRMKTAGMPELLGYADKIKMSALKAAGLTQSLLSFARKSPMEMKPFDMHECIGQAVDILEHTLGSRIAITFANNARRSIVVGNQAQVENALLNLGINARDAMPDGGALRIETDLVENTADLEPSVAGRLEPGVYIRMTVGDTGVGMDDATRQHLFEPFFTTKAAGKGTGLGLATVFGIVQEHKGLIAVESHRGTGTTFTLYFPLQKSGPDEPAREECAGPGKILIVDDEEAACEYITHTLLQAQYGYKVCLDGQSAVDYFHREHGCVVMVILDLKMRPMNGLTCMHRLLEIRPDIPIIIATGLSADAPASQQAMQAGAAAFLHKPYDGAQLLASIQKASEYRIAGGIQADEPT
jgi:PAS domain S-box-containing protein